MILDCFLLLVRIRPNILWMCRLPGRGAARSSSKDLLPWPSENPQKGARLGLGELAWGSASCREGPLLFLSVWLASVFGLAFFLWGGGVPFRLFVFGFLECLLFRQDSRFPLLIIKIWKLNFHSIFFFSNHLIKISSTTTKKIRSSCSK